ncbi:MAG: DNA polymerase III subunit delta, partial [Anaerovorax sp.]
NNDKGEHPYKKLAREMKANEVKNLLFFYGKEQYLVNWATEALIHKYVNPICKELDLTKLDGMTVTFQEIINCCETLPMMSEKKLVILSQFKVADGSYTNYFNEEDEKKLVAYFEEMPPQCLLIMTGDTIDKRKKFFKTVNTVGGTYDFYNLDEGQLKGFIEKRLKIAGKKAKPNVIRTFMDITGYYDKNTDYTLYNLENDLKKMISYSQGEEVFLADVAVAVSGNVDTDIFAMIDALSRDR